MTDLLNPQLYYRFLEGQEAEAVPVDRFRTGEDLTEPELPVAGEVAEVTISDDQLTS